VRVNLSDDAWGERTLPRRVAVLTVHTSPMDQPGTGHAGGMNVYIAESARRLAERGVAVDVYTRATGQDQPPVMHPAPGVTVRNIVAGPFEALDRADLARQLCPFTFGVLRAEAGRDPGYYDLVHSHYWLAGQVGRPIARRWGVPLVHTMHTMARVKNASLATGDRPEPAERVTAEQHVVADADRLVANTHSEARELVSLYDAEPSRVAVVHPGVDLRTFRPGDPAVARARLGLPRDATVLLFVGRVQPHKAPDVLLRAAAELLRRDPRRAERLVVAVVGGLAGDASARRDELHGLADRLGIADLVRMVPPCPQPRLADWYRAATATVVPSHSESFGLVAAESQACGTPVVAANVGGLRTVVRHGETGWLVDGHDPSAYADALATLVDAPHRRAVFGASAVRHTRGFGWDATIDGLLDAYTTAMTGSAATGLPSAACR
jgi:D-inositol-3-phosphate glycosyltransferase